MTLLTGARKYEHGLNFTKNKMENLYVALKPNILLPVIFIIEILT